MKQMSSKTIFIFLFHLSIFPLLFTTICTAETPSPSSSLSIISRLQEYLRINTAHPDPNYHEAAEFLVKQAKSMSLEYQVIEFVENKPVILIKWAGKDPSLSSVILNSHTDVVPAEDEKWTYPPFDAHIDSNGDIYARGIQDMKSVGMQYLEAIRKLKDQGFEPTRTLYVSFVPDEEIGGADGAQKLVESELFEKMNVGIELDEGVANPGKKYFVFYGEKAPWRLVIKAKGVPGHGASLYDNSAMENLVKSLETIYRFRASQFDMVKAQEKSLGDIISVNMVYLKAGTETETGFIMNVQPSEAEAGFDIRVPPTVDVEGFEKRIADEWAPTSRNMIFELEKNRPLVDIYGKPMFTVANNSNPWWVLLEEAVHNAGGKLERPEILPGSSDASHFRVQGIPSFGFSPMSNTPILLHDHNERLNQEEYLKGVDVYASIIKAYASHAEQTEAKAY